jgi:hypothetical protein
MGMVKSGLMAAVLAMGLVACGGGGGGGDAPGGGSSDLYDAYNKVAAGQTYEQVRDIVGYDNNNGQIETRDLIRYDWIANKNTLEVTILYVEVRKSGGVTSKAVGGPKGNFVVQY